MVDVARTTVQIIADFADGGGIGNETPQKVRNAFISGPQWDTLAGVPAPNIIRGCVDGLKYFQSLGGITGDLSGNTGARITNGTNLKATFDYSTTNSKWLELPPAVYEINNAAGLVPAFTGSGNFAFRLRGSMMGTIISQFYTTTQSGPILTVGDPTNTLETQGLDIQGLALRYGTSVSTKTSAAPIVLGWLTNSVVDNINIMGDSNPGYDAVQMMGLCFSNEFRNWRIWGWQRHGFYIGGSAGGSTGNTHSNWYMTPGGGPPSTFGTMTGNYICQDVGVSDVCFIRLNTEWGATNAVVRAGWNAVLNGIQFLSWHLEGIRLTGANPSVLQLAGAQVDVHGMELQSFQVMSANFTGNAALVADWMGGSSTVKIDSLNFVQWLSSFQNTNVYMLAPYSLDASSTVLQITNGRVNDASGTAQITGRLYWDQHLAPTANVLVQKFIRSKFGIKGSIIEGAVLNVSGAYSHYGQHEDAIIVLAATGSYTVNLMHVMGATGTQLPRTGNTVTFLRPTYTSGTVTIQTNGGALTTNASAVAVYCQFTGSAWATYTPVT